MRKRWPFTFNIVLFAAVAFVSPFMVLYYQDLGFTGTQIGVLTGISPLIIFFSAPLWTGLADTTQRHRYFMSAAILMGAICLLLFPLVSAFWLVFLAAIVLFFFMAPVTPFSDSAAMFMLGEQKDMYGRIRLGGTIGYGLAATISGMFVQNFGLRFAFWGSAVLMFLGFIVSQKLVYGKSTSEGPAKGRIRLLLSNPRWILFLIVAFSAGMGMAAYNNYLFPYMKDLGASESFMGLVVLVGTLSEIPVLFFSNYLIKRFNSYGLYMMSMFITGLRMILFAVFNSPGMILIIQLLNGVTFATMWIAGVTYADENTSPGLSATAQGLFNAMVLGIGNAVGGFVGGLLLERIGGAGLYLVFGVATLLIVSAIAILHPRLVSNLKAAPNQ